MKTMREACDQAADCALRSAVTELRLTRVHDDRHPTSILIIHDGMTLMRHDQALGFQHLEDLVKDLRGVIGFLEKKLRDAGAYEDGEDDDMFTVPAIRLVH